MGFLSVDSSQVQALTVDIGRAAGAVGAGVSKIVRKTAHDIESDAKRLSAVDTGTNRSSISTTITGDGRFGEIAAEIGPTTEYGVYLELGTSRMAAQPFMAPAFDRRVPGMEKAIGTLGEQIL